DAGNWVGVQSGSRHDREANRDVFGTTAGIIRPMSQPQNHDRPTIAITMGDPAGIGAEVIVKALADPSLRQRARFIIYGLNEILNYAADLSELDVFWWRDTFGGKPKHYGQDVVVVDYDNFGEFSLLGNTVRGP